MGLQLNNLGTGKPCRRLSVGSPKKRSSKRVYKWWPQASSHWARASSPLMRIWRGWKCHGCSGCRPTRSGIAGCCGHEQGGSGYTKVYVLEVFQYSGTSPTSLQHWYTDVCIVLYPGTGYTKYPGSRGIQYIVSAAREDPQQG